MTFSIAPFSTAPFSAEAGRILTADASVSGSASVSAVGVRVQPAVASVSGAGTVSSSAVRIQSAGASVSGAGTVSSTGNQGQEGWLHGGHKNASSGFHKALGSTVEGLSESEAESLGGTLSATAGFRGAG